MTSTSVQTTRSAIWRPRIPPFMPESKYSYTLLSRGLCKRHQGSGSLMKLSKTEGHFHCVFGGITHRLFFSSPTSTSSSLNCVSIPFIAVVIPMREQLSFLDMQLQHEAEATHQVWIQREHNSSISPLWFSETTICTSNTEWWALIEAWSRDLQNSSTTNTSVPLMWESLPGTKLTPDFCLLALTS